MVFLFVDTQIKSDVFLEDINNVLNAGDVPNLYAFDELDKIYSTMKPIVQVGLCALKKIGTLKKICPFPLILSKF